MPVIYEPQRKTWGQGLTQTIMSYLQGKRQREQQDMEQKRFGLEEQLTQSQMEYNQARANTPTASRFKPLIKKMPDGRWHSVIIDITTGEVINDLGLAPPRLTYDPGDLRGINPEAPIESALQEQPKSVPPVTMPPTSAGAVSPPVQQSHMRQPETVGPPSPWTPAGTPVNPDAMAETQKLGDKRVEVEKDGKRYTVPLKQLKQALEEGYKRVK